MQPRGKHNTQSDFYIKTASASPAQLRWWCCPGRRFVAIMKTSKARWLLQRLWAAFLCEGACVFGMRVAWDNLLQCACCTPAKHPGPGRCWNLTAAVAASAACFVFVHASRRPKRKTDRERKTEKERDREKEHTRGGSHADFWWLIKIPTLSRAVHHSRIWAAGDCGPNERWQRLNTCRNRSDSYCHVHCAPLSLKFIEKGT